LLPLWLVVSVLVLLDLGMPIFFWQQRIGINGHPFLVYKFRTMRAPFDGRGERIPEERRTSIIGHFLRETRLDELPQLLNVLVGDMDLIGPRPLLPRDQPENPTTRLLVRPGITGWAQINGGTLLTPAEKDELDEWYIRNASLWLDVRITLMTLFVLSGRRRQSGYAQRPGHAGLSANGVVHDDSTVNVPLMSFGPHMTNGNGMATGPAQSGPMHAIANSKISRRKAH
jgi:lipopolysaccharide/colanic/teichoic acid biosynthesis glycosyltransferase